MTRELEQRLIRVDALTGARLLRDASLVEATLRSSAPSLELGDAWAGLHVLLSGGDPPIPRHVALARGLAWDDRSLENVLMGGEPTPLGDGFTFARYLAPATVRMLADRLAKLSPEAFAARYGDHVLGYLPARWRALPARAELTARFEQLVRWYRDAAEAGDGLVLALS